MPVQLELLLGIEMNVDLADTPCAVGCGGVGIFLRICGICDRLDRRVGGGTVRTVTVFAVEVLRDQYIRLVAAHKARHGFEQPILVPALVLPCQGVGACVPHSHKGGVGGHTAVLQAIQKL